MNIDSNTLRYYVQNAQIPLADLQAEIDNLDKFLTGEQSPTFAQLSKLAKKLNIPTGLLLLKRKVDITSQRIEFRKLHATEPTSISENLRDIIIDMRDKQDFLRSEIDYTLDFIGSYTLDHDPMTVADGIRQRLDIPKFFQTNLKNNGKVIEYLRQKANNIGVFIFANGIVRKNTHRPLNIEEFRGFVLSDDKAPIIFINQKDSKTGQIFTIVHELVHLFIGEDEIFTIIDTGDFTFDKVEAFVNKVTAELLVPAETLLDFNTLDTEFLAKKFCVSEFVIARRLLSLNKITKADYDRIIAILERDFELNLTKEKKNGSGNYNNDIKFKTDKSFLCYIAQAINHHRITYTDAFNIIGVGYKGYQTLLGTNQTGANHG